MGPYRDGFGDLRGEHWLGLEKMHQITRTGSYELLILFGSFAEVVKTAKYADFKIGSETKEYQLNLEKFVEGEAGDKFFFQMEITVKVGLMLFTKAVVG